MSDMSPAKRALLDALLVERFTPYRPEPAPEPAPKALRLIHDARPLTPHQAAMRRRREAS